MKTLALYAAIILTAEALALSGTEFRVTTGDEFKQSYDEMKRMPPL